MENRRQITVMALAALRKWKLLVCGWNGDAAVTSYFLSSNIQYFLRCITCNFTSLFAATLRDSRLRVTSVIFQWKLNHFSVCYAKVTPSGSFSNCAVIFKQSMEARNRVGIGLSYRPAMQATYAGGIDSLESILGGSLKV
jgi:hypothetical protein